MIATVIKMSALPGGAKPTYTGSTVYPPTLAYFPILWNAAPIQWFGIANLTLDGNGLDVYGLRLQENFYGAIRNLVITNCNKRPYINVLGQSIHHEHLILYTNRAAALAMDNTMFVFQTCGFERTGAPRAVEVYSPVSTKAGVSFRDCWFEDSTTYPAAGAGQTTEAYLAISGRNPVVSNSFFHHDGASGPANILGIKTLGAADSATFDGITASNVNGAMNGRFHVNYSDGVSGTTFTADSYGNELTGFFDHTAVTDANGNNAWQNGAYNYPSRVSNSAWELRSTNAQSYFKIDPTVPRIELWGDSWNRIGTDSGIFEIASKIGMRLNAGQLDGGTERGGPLEILVKPGTNVSMYDRLGASSWQTGHLVLGTTHLWLDGQARLRMKAGSAPASDGEGAPFGQFVAAPGAANTACQPGHFSADATYLYVCHAANTWKRVAIATW
jgi:hypothetical protein